MTPPVGVVALPVGVVALPVGVVALPVGVVALPVGGVALPVRVVALPVRVVALPVGVVAVVVAPGTHVAQQSPAAVTSTWPSGQVSWGHAVPHTTVLLRHWHLWQPRVHFSYGCSRDKIAIAMFVFGFHGA